MNNLTTEDIKNGIEYQWRMHLVKFCLAIYGVVCILLLVILLPMALFESNVNTILVYVYCGLGECVIFGLIFLPSVFFNLCKARRLLKNYQKLQIFEVVLDKPNSSLWYRRGVYFTVTLSGVSDTKDIDTSPCFSSGIFAKFELAEYANKRVAGLYDEENDKFYLINIVR